MAQTPACPRCGYDQRGVIDSWTRSCPLTGICSECGHRLRWAEVLDPRAMLVRWFVEHPFPGRRLLRRVVATWLWVVLPWVFWDRVGVKLPLSRWRMVLWLGFPLATIHLVAGVAGSVTSWQVWSSSSYYDLNLALVIVWLGPLVGAAVREYTLVAAPVPDQWPYPVMILLAISLGMPLLLLMLSGTRKACRLRRAHVWRAMVYGFAWVFVLAVARAASHIDALANVFHIAGTSPWWVFGGRRNWTYVQIHEHPWRWGSVLIVWSMVWWWCAIARGFRLPDAGVVWSLLMIVCLLLGGVLLINNQIFLLEYFG